MDLQRLATLQHGVLSRAQVLELGVSDEALRWRLSTGRWAVVHPGVYRVHTGELDWSGRASAALLRLGDGAALGLASAAFVLGIDDTAPQVLCLMVPHECQRRRVPGSRVTRRRRLETTVSKGLRATTAAETVVDLGAAFGATRQDAISVAARAVQRRRTTVAEIAAALQRRRTHPHRRALELGLGVVGEGAESALEVDFHEAVLAAHGLPPMQLAVADVVDGQGIRRDFESAEFGVVVEVDGRIGHGAAEHDRDNRRDRRTARAGKVTLRAGWVDVELEPCDLAIDLFGTFASRGWRGELRSCGPLCRGGDRRHTQAPRQAHG